MVAPAAHGEPAIAPPPSSAALPHWLPSPLRGEGPAILALLWGGMLALIPALPLSMLVSALMPALDRPEFPTTGTPLLIAVVVIAPVIETLIMAAVLALLLLVASPRIAIVLSALGWAVAHSLEAAAWGLVIWWPFLVFSTLYVAWRKRGLLLSLAVPAGAHALNNLLPGLMVAFAA